jgi:hypothetical protein
MFSDNQIEVIQIPWTYRPPQGYTENFLSAFYKLDCLQYLKKIKSLKSFSLLQAMLLF